MKTYLVLGLAALLATACKKDDPEAGLPPATHEGRNTGGCLINGERFVATGWGGSLLSNGTSALAGGFYEDSLYYLTLSGVTGRGNTRVYLFLRSQQSGKYLFNQNTLNLDRGGLRYRLDYAACSFSGSDELYITNGQHTGQLILATNPSSGVSSGTFEFTAASTFDRSKTVTITSGRFDRRQ